MKGISNLLLFVLGWVVFIALTLGLGLLLAPLYYVLVFAGSDKRAARAGEKLQSTLMKGETVLASGLQLRLYALFSRRLLVAITNSRLILVNRSLLGGFSMQDYQWKDLADTQLAENILPGLCGSRVSFAAAGGKPAMLIDGLPGDIASTLYSHAQSQEQQWEEKNRVRGLEEKRAASGGAILNVGAGGHGGSVQSTFDELEKAKQLLDNGTISDAEYQEIKAKILSRGTF